MLGCVSTPVASLTPLLLILPSFLLQLWWQLILHIKRKAKTYQHRKPVGPMETAGDCRGVLTISRPPSSSSKLPAYDIFVFRFLATRSDKQCTTGPKTHAITRNKRLGCLQRCD